MKIDHVINENGELVFPALGDGELIQVNFINPDLSIVVNQYYPSRDMRKIFELKIYGCIFCSIESDHMQNVISEVYIIEGFSKFSKLSLFSKSFESKIWSYFETNRLKKINLFVITPISGIELFATFDRIEIHGI